MNTMMPLLIMVVGVVVLGMGVFSFFQQRARLGRFTRTEGVVTQLLPVSGGHQEFVVSKAETGVQINPKRRYRLEVEFKPQNGRKVTFISRIATRPPRCQPGEQVPVLYNPQDPADARLNSSLELWFGTVMLVGWGVFAIGMGCLAWLLSNL